MTKKVRAYGRNFTEKFVYSGREVELRRGYSKGESLWGRVGKVIVGSLEDIFSKVDFKLVEPQKKSQQDAISENRELLGDREKYIAFQVFLNNIA